MAEREGSPTSLLLVSTASAWVVFAVDAVTPGHIGHGIEPRTVYGLTGIVMAPFLHGSLQHLLANTVPFVILGAVILLRGARAFLTVAVVSALIGGFGTWLFGTPGTMHIGASGVVFGFFGYLLFRAAYDRRLSSFLIAVVVAALYGTSLLMSIIPAQGISWSGHLFGFLGGVYAARLRYGR